MTHEHEPIAASRRMVCAGLPLLALVAGSSVSVSSGAAATVPSGGLAPQTPLGQIRSLLRMMASVGAAAVPWYYTGRIYAVREGLSPAHLYNFEGSEIYWVKPLGPQSWSLAVSTLTFYRDRISGEYLERFDNPLTGKTVTVASNVLRSKPGEGAVYQPQSLSVMGKSQPVTVEIDRNKAVVWLTTSRANPDSPQPSMEVNTLYCDAGDFDNARRENVHSTFGSVSLSHWSRWLDMGDEEGHLLWHAAGRKLDRMEELPARYRERADALHRVHFLNPELMPAEAAPAVVAAAAGTQPATVPVDAGDPELRFSYVDGAGGVPLSVAQAGAAEAPGILFLHGLGQSHLSFERQLHSSLVQRFHLVAFDLRGHGNSGKPWEGAAYRDGKLYADDVARVIAATGLQRPLIVAWSYGTLITADYVRHRGSRDLSGIVLIGALGGLAALPLSAFDPAIMAKMQHLRELTSSPGLENTLAASHAVVPLLTARPMSRAWITTCETVGALVPPFARTAMGARMTTDNKDLVPQIHVPMMLLAGSEDRGTPRSLMQNLADSLPGHAQVVVYEGSGHSPFAEEPERFNRDLEAFATRAFAYSEQGTP